jgi:hypothetical protein
MPKQPDQGEQMPQLPGPEMSQAKPQPVLRESQLLPQTQGLEAGVTINQSFNNKKPRVNYDPTLKQIVEVVCFCGWQTMLFLESDFSKDDNQKKIFDLTDKHAHTAHQGYEVFKNVPFSIRTYNMDPTFPSNKNSPPNMKI